MDDKDRIGEARGSEDAPRPRRPGGERTTGGEMDQQPDPSTAVPAGPESGGVEGTGGSRGEEERAAGDMDDAVPAEDGFASDLERQGDPADPSA